MDPAYLDAFLFLFIPAVAVLVLFLSETIATRTKILALLIVIPYEVGYFTYFFVFDEEKRQEVQRTVTTYLEGQLPEVQHDFDLLGTRCIRLINQQFAPGSARIFEAAPRMRSADGNDWRITWTIAENLPAEAGSWICSGAGTAIRRIEVNSRVLMSAPD